MYEKESVILVENKEDEHPTFGKVKNIFYADGEIYFALILLRGTVFDDHYYAYTVNFNDDLIVIRRFNDLPEFVPSISIRKKNVYYVATRHIL